MMITTLLHIYNHKTNIISSYHVNISLPVESHNTDQPKYKSYVSFYQGAVKKNLNI